ncbi:MAG: phenylalanine--tRNA ligase subunit beta [Armatimonadetes bacterium]|nr:phenylalanine--tRNA ligase subunit beta [Armatimonadota bacterium]
MFVPLDWISDYVDLRMTPQETAEALTMLGLEVEDWSEAGASGSAVLDITVTSNRGDCLSMIGVARELAADENVALKQPSFEMLAEGPPAEELAAVQIADEELCYRYAATIVQGVQVGESPEWMQSRLSAAGMRPINNIVDVTNYVMLETGQPLHAFDLDLLGGQQIIVRRARQGETLVTLDGQKRELTTDMLAICDRDRPVAVAGVMGGAESEVTGKTVNVLIESACFNGSSIRRTSRALGLPTEASYRFERGVDLGGTARAATRAAELIRQLAGGTIAQGVIDVVAREPQEREVLLRPQRASKLLGIPLTAEECQESLGRLSFETKTQGGDLLVRIPTYRNDINEEIDLIEEIGRVIGFNNLPSTLIDGVSLQGKDSQWGKLESKVRGVLQSCGLQEVVTHSIVPRETPEAQGIQPVELRNALSADVAKMRTSLVPSLVQVLGGNFSHDIRDLWVFEVGKVFHQGEAAPAESRRVAGCLMGTRWDGAWTLPDKKLHPEGYARALSVDFYQAKGAVEELLQRCGIDSVSFCPTAGPLWRDGYVAEIRQGDSILGFVGEVRPELRQAYGLKAIAFGFELNLEALRDLQTQDLDWSAPSRFPAVKRDLAIVVDQAVEYATVVATIRRSAPEILEGIELFDMYQGEQLAPGKKSLAYSLTFRSYEKTLTEDEISAIIAAVRSALETELGAQFRE